MTITLTSELEKLVRQKVERGDYEDAEALVQEAVHRLIEEDEVNPEALRERFGAADAEMDNGNFASLMSTRPKTSPEIFTCEDCNGSMN